VSLLITIVAFLLAIGVLVTFHELGHYAAARWCDVKVLRFSIGFGRPLRTWHRGPDRTEWVIAVFPLGGYVKMVDERDGSAGEADVSRAFNRKPVWQRMFIIAAGPLANFLLAMALYWLLLMAGTPGVRPYLAEPLAGTAAARAEFADFDRITRIGNQPVQAWSDARMLLLEQAVNRATVEIEVETAAEKHVIRRLDMSGVTNDDLDRDFLARLGLVIYHVPVSTAIRETTGGGPADRAGLRGGDRITAVEGIAVRRWEELVAAVSARPGKITQMRYERGGQAAETILTPDVVIEKGRTFGRIGVSPVVPKMDRALIDRMSMEVRLGPIEALPRAALKVWEMSIFSLKMMGRMLTGDVSWKNLSGPITIADYAGQTAQMGWMPYLNFLALVSISLGVLNLLPVPVLDGGQLMYHIAELIKGSPVSERTMEIGQQVGLTLLLGLTAFAFYNDIFRLVSG
jgi:regulator of sigma E protease